MKLVITYTIELDFLDAPRQPDASEISQAVSEAYERAVSQGVMSGGDLGDKFRVSSVSDAHEVVP